jgi:hypothetical protein
MKSKTNIPRNEDNLQGILVSRAYTAAPEDQINLFNYSNLQSDSEKIFFPKSKKDCKDLSHSSDTSKESIEGGGAPQLDQQTECIDTQISISFSGSEPARSLKNQESKEERACLSLSSNQLLCLDLPPKTIKSLDDTIQRLKTLNIERARLLSFSPDKSERALSRELFQCSRNIRISKDGRPNYWRCRKTKDCHICQYFDQQEKLKIFKSNLLRNRYAPHQWKLITLTLPRTYAPNEIRGAIKKLNSNFTKLTRRKAWQLSIEGGIKSIEWPRSKEDPKRYRPHIHLLVAVNDSFSSNRLFQKTKRSLEKLKANPELGDSEILFNLSFVWGKYFNRQNVHTHIRDLKKLGGTTDDLPWLKPNQIDPDEITYTALEYITKVIQRDCSTSESPTPSLTTSTLIRQVKGLRRISSFGSLQGYLTKPKRRKKTEKEKQDLIDSLRSSNTRAIYQYNSETRAYEKVDSLKPHFESWLLFKDKASRQSSPCISSSFSPPQQIPIQLENPLRCKDLAIIEREK